MATKLTKPLKREIEHAGAAYVVTITDEGITVVPKGKRKGQFLAWSAIISGDASLLQDLRISLDATRRDA